MASNCAIFFISLSVGLALSLGLNAQCNGSQNLCEKHFDEVAYLTTHNAFNAQETGFFLPNQTYGITRQLQDGVRGLMLDIYNENGVVTMYHSFAGLGSATFESALIEIRDFLNANPNEIVSIILQCYVSLGILEPLFQNLSLMPLLYSHDPNSEWPRLSEMIANNERLVVFSDCNDAGAGQGWYHYVWDYSVETDFTNHDTTDFSCAFNRGRAANDLFIMNHFLISDPLGVGIPALSDLANDYEFMERRVAECMASNGKFPNFFTVDFYELGSTKAIVDLLNGVPTSNSSLLDELTWQLFPTVASGNLKLKLPPGSNPPFLTAYNLSGHSFLLSLSADGLLDISLLVPGRYFLCSDSKIWGCRDFIKVSN